MDSSAPLWKVLRAADSKSKEFIDPDRIHSRVQIQVAVCTEINLAAFFV